MATLEAVELNLPGDVLLLLDIAICSSSLLSFHPSTDIIAMLTWL